jgi:hypothetical protein
MKAGSQATYRIRFERGESGLRAIATDASVVVIVDVLSFSTQRRLGNRHGVAKTRA